MGRKKGFNKEKIVKIINVLVSHPDGTWIRAIADEAGLAPNTVRHYIQGVLNPLVIDTSLGRSEKPHLRVIRLKPFVFERLSEGKNIGQILKMLKAIEDIE